MKIGMQRPGKPLSKIPSASIVADDCGCCEGVGDKRAVGSGRFWPEGRKTMLSNQSGALLP